MGKCVHCGGSFLLHKKIKLQDAEICSKCFHSLGFDKTNELISHLYKYDDIKNGSDAYYEAELNRERLKAANVSIMSNHGQERERIATEDELYIYEKIKEMAQTDLELVRISDNYVTVKHGEWDLARIKYTNKAKWVLFPTLEKSSEKHYIESPEEIINFAELITASLEHIRKYS